MRFKERGNAKMGHDITLLGFEDEAGTIIGSSNHGAAIP